jgi:hypothetical protein
MVKRIFLSSIALVAAGVCGVLWARSGRPPTLSLGYPSTHASPADDYWSWTFPLPDRATGERISLQLRQKSTPLPPGASPTIGFQDKAMQTAEAEHLFGTGMIVRSGADGAEPPGMATIQLLDLSEAGVASTAPEKSLRVLAKLSIHGAEVKLSSDATILSGKRFAGRSVRNEGTWANGELYLMTFWVEGDGTLTQYDVLLEQSADRRAH